MPSKSNPVAMKPFLKLPPFTGPVDLNENWPQTAASSKLLRKVRLACSEAEPYHIESDSGALVGRLPDLIFVRQMEEHWVLHGL